MVLGDDTSCYDYAGHKFSSKRAHSTASTVGRQNPEKICSLPFDQSNSNFASSMWLLNLILLLFKVLSHGLLVRTNAIHSLFQPRKIKMYTRLTFLACLMRDAVLEHMNIFFSLVPVTFALLVQHCLPKFSSHFLPLEKDKGD